MNSAEQLKGEISMAQPIKYSDIKAESIPVRTDQYERRQILAGEIPGASVLNYNFPGGTEECFEGGETFIRIFFLCSGSACFSTEGKSMFFDGKAVFTTLPDRAVTLKALSGISLLEIRWEMNELDLADLKESSAFPFGMAYEDSPQYRDFFKSEKTISRSIIPQTMIPRFAMGSVETKADDLIGQHAHPLLDQFFFSFPENDALILIDSCIYPLGGNTLLHIPLGSNHGVIALDEQYVHYLWMDFTPQELKKQAVDYLNEVHKPTGKKERI